MLYHVHNFELNYSFTIKKIYCKHMYTCDNESPIQLIYPNENVIKEQKHIYNINVKIEKI
jgi:hypothetical protein